MEMRIRIFVWNRKPVWLIARIVRRIELKQALTTLRHIHLKNIVQK